MSKNYTFLLQVVVHAENHNHAENLLFNNIKSKIQEEQYGLVGIVQLK